MAMEMKTETAIADYMETAHLVDEMTCVVRSTSDLPTDLSTAESSDQDSCVGYWTDSTSDRGDNPQLNSSETSPVSDWTDVGQRLSRVFQNFDSDEEDDAEDFAEPSSLPIFRLPPVLTLEALDAASGCSSDVATEDGVKPLALRLSETFRNFDPDEDAGVESDMEDVFPRYMDQDISSHDIPDFGPPPGLTREVVAPLDADEVSLHILMNRYYLSCKEEMPPWRALCLQLASAVANVKADGPDM